jgi:hypothetical protein
LQELHDREQQWYSVLLFGDFLLYDALPLLNDFLQQPVNV